MALKVVDTKPNFSDKKHYYGWIILRKGQVKVNDLLMSLPKCQNSQVHFSFCQFLMLFYCTPGPADVHECKHKDLCSTEDLIMLTLNREIILRCRKKCNDINQSVLIKMELSKIVT